MMNAKIWTNALSAWTTATPSHLALIQTEVLGANAWKDFKTQEEFVRNTIAEIRHTAQLVQMWQTLLQLQESSVLVLEST